MFEDVFPYYMAIGMSYDEFWLGASSLAIDYRRAHEYKIEYDNQLAWVQGMYYLEALSTVIGNAFGGNKGKALKYPEKPYDLLGREEKAKEEKARKEREKLIAALSLWKDRFDKQHGKAN